MKRLCISAVLSLFIVLIGMFLNYRTYQEDHYLKYSFKSYGGEITIEHGFGLEAVHIYTMEMDGHNSHHLRVSIFSFLLYWLGITLIVYIVLAIGAFVLRKRM